MRIRSDAGSSGATTVDAILDDLRLSARMGWSSMAEQKRNRSAQRIRRNPPRTEDAHRCRDDYSEDMNQGPGEDEHRRTRSFSS